MVLTLTAALLLGVAVFTGLGLAAFAWRVHTYPRTLPAAPSGGAIVVLGARLSPEGRPTPAFEGRIERAVELFREGAAPLVVFSGGAGQGGVTESLAALRYAQSLGLAESVCVLEDVSRTTQENARCCAALLRDRGVVQVVLVTDGFHLFRAVRWFRTVGLDPRPAASRRVLMPRTRLYSTLREVVAYLRAPPERG